MNYVKSAEQNSQVHEMHSINPAMENKIEHTYKVPKP
jgi:hypothetical protein